MFGAAAACRAKHRLQPGEPKPRPAEARKTRPAGFGTKTTTAPTEAELANLQPALFLNKANAACGVASPATTEAASLRAGRLRLTQHCELQNRRTTKNGDRTIVRKQLFLINPPTPLRRQRTAESTQTTLTRAVTPITPGQLFSDAKIADSAAGCRYRYIFCTVATMYPGLSAHTSELRNRRSHAIRGRSIPAENRHLTATNDQKKHVATPAGGLTEKAIRHRRTKINHYLRAAYTPIKPSCSNTIS